MTSTSTENLMHTEQGLTALSFLSLWNVVLTLQLSAGRLLVSVLCKPVALHPLSASDILLHQAESMYTSEGVSASIKRRAGGFCAAWDSLCYTKWIILFNTAAGQELLKVINYSEENLKKFRNYWVELHVGTKAAKVHFFSDSPQKFLCIGEGHKQGIVWKNPGKLG